MKKFICVLMGAVLAVGAGLGLAACADDSNKENENNNGGGEYQLNHADYDITLQTGADPRVKLSVSEDGYYLIEYSEVFRNEYIAVSADVSIDLTETNTFTMVYENIGEKTANVSIEFMDAEGNTGYGGGDLAAGEEKNDVINMELCHQYGSGVPLGTVTQIQIFFDSGYSSNTADLTSYSGSFLIKSIKLSDQEEETPELPGENDVKLDAQIGDLWINSDVTALTADNDSKTIERVTSAPSAGDYASWAGLNYSGMNAACYKIVFTLGEETDFDMLMIQVQTPNGDGSYAEVINYQVLTPASGEQQLVIDLTAGQAQQMVETDHQYFMIWLDANSGNGTGNLVIESVEFWAPEGTVIDPDEPSGEDGSLLDTTMGDLWKNETVTTLTTDNDAKKVTRVTEASEAGDYGSWAALNYADMSADCRKIVVTLGEGTSCNMVMLQVQNADGSQIIDQNWGSCKAGDELIIELTAEHAQQMCDTTNKYFMIWLDANSGNGCGTLVIESVQFFAAAE